MRQVYTNESYVLAMNSKNRLEAATSILEAAPDDGELADWVCQYCKQTVPGNFSVCWKCQVGAG